MNPPLSRSTGAPAIATSTGAVRRFGHCRSPWRASLLAVVTAIFASTSQAAPYHLKPSETSLNDWNVLDNWAENPDGTGASPAVMAGNDFFLNGSILGTPSGDTTFFGDSLTLNGGIFNVRNSGTKTIASIIVTADSGLISNIGNTLDVATFDNVSGTATLQGVGSGLAPILTIFDFAALTGSGDFALRSSATVGQAINTHIVLAVGNAANWTGDIGGWTNPDETEGRSLTLAFGGDTVFGGSLTAPSHARITLDFNVTFASVSLDGGTTFLAPGTYDFATLNASYDSIFNDGGSGSITVVPEPATMALLSLGGLLLATRRGTRPA